MELIQIDRQTERIARLCHALANPLRVAIVRYIASYPRCICNDIVVRTDRAQSTISGGLDRNRTGRANQCVLASRRSLEDSESWLGGIEPPETEATNAPPRISGLKIIYGVCV